MSGPHQLSTEETQWCLQLRAALAEQQIPEPAPKSDYLLAQFALIAKGDVEKGINRIKKYNEVVTTKFEYDPAQAMQSESFGWWSKAMPECLEVCGDTKEEKYSTVSYNIGKYDPQVILEKDENFGILVQDMCVMMDAMNADLDEIRKGCVYISSCATAGMKNYNQDLEKRLAEVYQDAYPTKYHEFAVVDGGFFINIILKLAKLFLKKKLRDRIKMMKSKELGNHGYHSSLLPPSLGGTFKQTFEDWANKRMARRAESITKVKIL